jgi:hypothetical protein
MLLDARIHGQAAQQIIRADARKKRAPLNSVVGRHGAHELAGGLDLRVTSRRSSPGVFAHIVQCRVLGYVLAEYPGDHRCSAPLAIIFMWARLSSTTLVTTLVGRALLFGAVPDEVGGTMSQE